MNYEDFVRNARRHPQALSHAARSELAAGQKPGALFIGCSDSRVIPSLITGAEPGALFELRTAGNVVPKYAPDSGSSEMGTIEYAVLRLGVPEIIVCGHSHCGAVTALAVAGQGLDDLPALCGWLGTGSRSGGTVQDPAVRAESQAHVREQLDALREYPFVQDRVAAGELRLHGWFYEIDTGRVHAQDAETGDFLPL
ncbi:carbonic anhydrase [Saccharopolyspora sp. CA-218241]|uniref:carbonic anhydrase n=1 Tax=Saccharopolyspora sp. CA-218241 TaxID=3240027 RepID=UPI003D9858C1